MSGPRTSSAPPSLSREAVEARIDILAAEMNAAAHAATKAALLFEVGSLIEQHLGDTKLAVKKYLGAYNLDQTFRPPLFALIRLFEERGSLKNLGRLYEAEARSAKNESEKASALLDLGTIHEDLDKDFDKALRVYEDAASDQSTRHIASLFLEALSRRLHRADIVKRALELRLAETTDSSMRGALWIELSELETDERQAIAWLDKATQIEETRWQALEALEARLPRGSERSIAALADRAALAEEISRGVSRPASVRFQDRSDARYAAAALWLRAASRRPDAAGTSQRFELTDHALRLAPEAPVLWTVWLSHLHEVGNDADMRIHARKMAATLGDFHARAALLVASAHSAYAAGDAKRALEDLEEALALDPSSTVHAALDCVRESLEQHGPRVAAWQERAGNAELDAPLREAYLRRAARISFEEENNLDRALELLDEAAKISPDARPALRERVRIAGQARAHDRARSALVKLIGESLEDTERATAKLKLHGLLRWELESPDDARRLLVEALDDSACRAWAPELVRLFGTRTENWQDVERAHRVLADRADDLETKASHETAAARALVRAGNRTDAIALLHQAFERNKTNRYTGRVLEALLRANNDAPKANEVARRLLEATDTEANTAIAEGAMEEASRNFPAAEEAYRRALHLPSHVVPGAFLMRALSHATDKRELETEALKALHSQGSHAATLELAEASEITPDGQETARTLLRELLDADESLGVRAAAALTLSPGATAADLDAAISSLARRVEGNESMSVEPISVAELATAHATTTPECADSIANLIESTPDDPWCHVWKIRTLPVDATTNDLADAWIRLGSTTTDPRTAGEILLHGFRARWVSEGAAAVDDQYLLAQELVSEVPEAAGTAIALDESVGPEDDPDTRAEALIARMRHAHVKDRRWIEPSLVRALIAAGRTAEALPMLRALLEKHPEDLSLWEALRGCARTEKAWTDVVRACDHIADALGGDLQAQLLEEAGVVWMDELQKNDEGEKRFLRALELDVRRSIAYGRVHDLWIEQKRNTDLLKLLARRIAVEESSELLEKLFYEQARLCRAEGEADAALRALDGLFLARPSHVGGLALAVEIYVSQNAWQNAVNALKALSEADVPLPQKRLAHLGAADFLDRHLHNPDGAMAELRKIEALGIADAALYARMAEIANGAFMIEEALEALEQAALLADTPSDRALYARRAGRLYTSQVADPNRAADAYRKALEALPTDVEAGDALTDLLVGPVERRELSERFEKALAPQLAANPTDEDAIRKLRRAAAWRVDRGTEVRALAALVALRSASNSEASAYEERRVASTEAPFSGPSEASLAWIRGLISEDLIAMSEALQSAGIGVRSLEDLGVGRAQLLPTNAPYPPAVQAALRWIDLLQVSHDEIYAHPNGEVAATVTRKGTVAWLLPVDAVPLRSEHVFDILLRAIALSLGVLPVVDRSADSAALLMFAAIEASGVKLQASDGYEAVATRARALGKALSRKTRKAVRTATGGIRDGGYGLEGSCRQAALACQTLAAAATNRLDLAIEAWLGHDYSTETVRNSEVARQLLSQWLSPQTRVLRRELGIET